MKRGYFKLLYLLLISTFSLSILSGQNLSLSVDQAIERAKKSNFDLKLMDQKVNEMEAKLSKTWSAFLPQLTVSETFTRTDEAMKVFGSKLMQNQITQTDFAEDPLNNPDAHNNFQTKIEFKQPIFNLDGFYGHYALKSAVISIRNKHERTAHYTAFQVKKSYFQLVLAKQSLLVIEQAIEVAQRNRDQAKNYYEHNVITKADYLMIEVRISQLESSKVDVENSIMDAQSNLAFMMGLTDDTAIIPSDTLNDTLKEIGLPDFASVNSDRSDMRARRHYVNSMIDQVKMKQSSFVPRINAFFNYEMHDQDTPFGGSGKGWIAGAQLKWDIFKGYSAIADIDETKTKLRYAEIELEKSKVENVNQIKSAYRKLQSMKKKLQLVKSSVDQSKESYRIINERYKNELEKTTDLLNADMKVVNGQLDYLKTLYGYNVTLYMIELLTERKI